MQSVKNRIRNQSNMSSKNSYVKSSTASSSRYAPTLSVVSEKSNETINLAAIPYNVPSLCIPRVFANISKERVEAVFRKLDIGEVERVDVVSRTDDKGETWKRVFVHLKWNDSELAKSARVRLLCGNDVKVIYEDPWFWKVSANRSTRTEQRPDQRQRYDQKPRGRGPREQQPVQSIRYPSEEKEYHPRSPSSSPPRQGEVQV